MYQTCSVFTVSIMGTDNQRKLVQVPLITLAKLILFNTCQGASALLQNVSLFITVCINYNYTYLYGIVVFTAYLLFMD